MGAPTDWLPLTGFVGKHLAAKACRVGAVRLRDSSSYEISNGEEWCPISALGSPEHYIEKLFNAIDDLFQPNALSTLASYYEPALSKLYIKFNGGAVYAFTRNPTDDTDNKPSDYVPQSQEHYLSLSMYGIF